MNETASTRNATSAARNTGSRGSPRIVFVPLPSPLFGILILIATVSTHTRILFRRSLPQKGLTPSCNSGPPNPRPHNSRPYNSRVPHPCLRVFCGDRVGILTLARIHNPACSGTQLEHKKILVTPTCDHHTKSLSSRRASAASKEESASSSPRLSRDSTALDECRRSLHCTPASANEKRPAVHAGLPSVNNHNLLCVHRLPPSRSPTHAGNVCRQRSTGTHVERVQSTRHAV